MKIKKTIRRLGNKYALRNAVKEGLDMLPTAVCFFYPSGTIRLCNAAMQKLFREIAGSDLQSYGELKEALDNCNPTTGIIRGGSMFVFPDGKTWQYHEQIVKTADGTVYTESVFSDVTGMYEKKQELKQQSGELKKMYRELKILSENVQEATREEEILQLKSLLHDQMNMGIAAIRQVLRQNTVTKEDEAAIAQFRRAIQILREENTCSQDDLAEFIHDAAVSGIQVKITGKLPETERELQLLLPVMREACVNAARHADATVLYVDVEQYEDHVDLRVMNDGKQPDTDIVPGGGLEDLRRMLAAVGGKMEIQSRPAFVLTVSLPVSHEAAYGG